MRGATGLWLAIVAVALACGGCAGRSPAALFYTLAPLNPPAAGVRPGTGTPVLVETVTLPEVLRHPQIVIRTAPQRVERSEFHRWASPLQSEIPRVVGENLAQLLGNDYMILTRSGGQPAWTLQLEFDRFDGAPEGLAELWARWTIQASDRAMVDRGQAILRRAVEGGDVAAVVSAQTQLLGELSRELAVRLQELAASEKMVR